MGTDVFEMSSMISFELLFFCFCFQYYTWFTFLTYTLKDMLKNEQLFMKPITTIRNT